jgi:uncharacterized protein (TIGR03066 family)
MTTQSGLANRATLVLFVGPDFFFGVSSAWSSVGSESVPLSWHGVRNTHTGLFPLTKSDVMRTLLSCTLALVFCGGLTADDKIDAKKLVGKWSPKEEAIFTVALTADGKATLVTTTSEGKVVTAEGTYKLDGNKLTATTKLDDKEQTLTFTIIKLTDDELVAKNEKGKERTLVRIKDKK